jgi:hypothetical protein
VIHASEHDGLSVSDVPFEKIDSGAPIRARSFEVDFNVKRESPSQTYKLERDRFNLNRSRSRACAWGRLFVGMTG